MSWLIFWLAIACIALLGIRLERTLEKSELRVKARHDFSNALLRYAPVHVSQFDEIRECLLHRLDDDSPPNSRSYVLSLKTLQAARKHGIEVVPYYQLQAVCRFSRWKYSPLAQSIDLDLRKEFLKRLETQEEPGVVLSEYESRMESRYQYIALRSHSEFMRREAEVADEKAARDLFLLRARVLDDLVEGKFEAREYLEALSEIEVIQGPVDEPEDRELTLQ